MFLSVLFQGLGLRDSLRVLAVGLRYSATASNCGLDSQSVFCLALEALQSLWMWPELAPTGTSRVIYCGRCVTVALVL
jgi:hypothetical protein